MPFSKDPAPDPPSGGGMSGHAFKAHAEASGSDGPDHTKASGITEAGGMSAGGPLRIGWSRSESKSYVEDGTLHAVTSSVAQDITIAGVLHIGSVEARAEAVHAGALAEATGDGRDGDAERDARRRAGHDRPDRALVQGKPLGEAPTAFKPILDQMAAHGMTIEPLPAPRLTRDEGTGLIEAASDGFRVLLQSPSGDAKFEMVFGRALARAGAVRAVDDTPLDLSTGLGEPVANDAGALPSTLTVSGRGRSGRARPPPSPLPPASFGSAGGLHRLRPGLRVGRAGRQVRPRRGEDAVVGRARRPVRCRPS